MILPIVGSPPQGRQEDCFKFKAGQGYTGEMVQKYKTDDDNNNNIMVGTETWWLQGGRNGTGTYCSTHLEGQLWKLKRVWR